MSRTLSFAMLPLLAACLAEPAPWITVNEARVTALPTSAAPYFTLVNSGGRDRLLSVDAGMADPSLQAGLTNNHHHNEDAIKAQPYCSQQGLKAGLTFVILSTLAFIGQLRADTPNSWRKPPALV